MITFQNESFASFYEDAQPLFPAHYDELSMEKGVIDLALDPARYETAEKQGILHIVTVRDGAKLIGYYVGAICGHLHYAKAGQMASTDMYYIKDDNRQGNLGLRMFQAVERSARAREAVKIYVTNKVHRDLSPMFDFLGYRWTDKLHTKMLR